MHISHIDGGVCIDTGNGIGRAGAKALADALETNSTLLNLDLGCT